MQTNTALHFVMFLPLIDISKEVMVPKIDYSQISEHHYADKIIRMLYSDNSYINA